MGKFAGIFQPVVYATERYAEFNLNSTRFGIELLSDSQIATEALGSYDVTAKIAWLCLEELIRLCRENKITVAGT